MNQALKIPGLSNSWTMPIRGRIDTLNTGIRTPEGLKIQGADLNKMQEIGQQAEKLLSAVPATRNVFAEHIGDGYFLDVNWDRQALARFGLSMEDARTPSRPRLAGTVIEARERYPVNVRYLRDFRSDLESLGRV